MGLVFIFVVISIGNFEIKIGIMGKKIFFLVNVISVDLKRNFYLRVDVFLYRLMSC